MEQKEIKIYLLCPCCDKVIKEDTMGIDVDYTRDSGRMKYNLPCIDCWNLEMGLFGDEANITSGKTKAEKMLEEDAKDMDSGDGNDAIDDEEEIAEEESKEEIEEDSENVL